LDDTAGPPLSRLPKPLEAFSAALLAPALSTWPITTFGSMTQEKGRSWLKLRWRGWNLWMATTPSDVIVMARSRPWQT
jgi:hypothetical protein